MRAIWSGSLSFGLINIPVNLYGAALERALKFRLLDKHGNCPVSYLKVCRYDGHEVKYQDIVRGYEYRKGDFVILSDDDLKKAAPAKSRQISIESFVPKEEIPTEQIDRPYYLEPDPRAEKAYVLLREALKRSGQVGIGRFVLRDKEHLVMIQPEDRALMLITLRYQDEVRPSSGLHLPDDQKFSQKELDMALMLIKQLEDHFRSGDYKDSYADALKDLIAKKAEGKPIHIQEPEPEPATDMQELMNMLKKSLEAERAKTRK